MRRKLFIFALPVGALVLSALACNFPGAPATAPATLVAEEAGAANEGQQAPADSQPPQQPASPTVGPAQAAGDAGEEGAPPTATPEPAAGCTDRAAFIADVSIPDGTEVAAGDAFTKTWRLRNAGTCTWTSSYALVFSHGDQMGGPSAIPLPGIVSPGQAIDLSVNLTAPASEGDYQGFWKLRNQDGVLFGVGGNGQTAFWVKITVPAEDSGDDSDDEETSIDWGNIIQPIGPIFALFVSSGTDQTLMADGCFDLDEGVIVGCGDPEADFKYETSLGGFPPQEEHKIRPRNGAKFAASQNDQPSGEDCQGASLTTSSRKVKFGYFCYQTSNGKYGYLRPTSASLFNLTFDWATYNFP